MAETNSKPSVIERIKRWFREMKSELKKVVWPNRKTMIKNTLVVLACVLAVGIFIWVFDAIAGLFVNGIISLVKG
ncbi:MAG: preprotein translocase subunit SecE [Oscillospiraceae bacterium]|jgi:preprotein translocase subunit SecE|nr:preprotein translocase subunit SecE [Oscillospiraceae bacterium]